MNATADRICFARKSRVVVLLIDALKYDFGVHDENLTDPLPYQNKLPIIHELMKQHPDKTRRLKFLADPPTTTLQRLKGMTTGSLPTFIDMGSNFATPEINEDNVIHQIHSNNLTAVFLGDSTWTELFPKSFKRKFSYPSFNIHDLDSVDNGKGFPMTTNGSLGQRQHADFFISFLRFLFMKFYFLRLCTISFPACFSTPVPCAVFKLLFGP